MLKTRIIPSLLWNGVDLVKGSGFDNWRTVSSVLTAIKVFNAREVDELVLYDIAATNNQRKADYTLIQQFASACFVPFTVGGGIDSVEDIANFLQAGADKVVINSACYNNIDLIQQAANQFGSQCIVAGIDAKRHGDHYHCYSHAGTVDTKLIVSDWIKQLERAGAGEIIISSIDNDGKMTGYDLDLLQQIAEVSIPIIACSGAGNYQHMLDALTLPHIDAVCASAIFQFTEQTPLGAKHFLAEKGFNMRI